MSSGFIIGRFPATVTHSLSLRGYFNYFLLLKDVLLTAQFSLRVCYVGGMISEEVHLKKWFSHSNLSQQAKSYKTFFLRQRGNKCHKFDSMPINQISYVNRLWAEEMICSLF